MNPIQIFKPLFIVKESKAPLCSSDANLNINHSSHALNSPPSTLDLAFDHAF